MKNIILVTLCILLTACNLDIPKNTRDGRMLEITLGYMSWHDHDLKRLIIALDACAESPTIMHEECTKRSNEAWTLVLGALRRPPVFE